jgi:tripartite-type tricarboxylate transporter receptor subunit TctC
VPKSTPVPIRKKLSRLIGKINANKKFKQEMQKRGFVRLNVPYSKIDAFMAKKSKYYKQLAKKAGLIK